MQKKGAPISKDCMKFLYDNAGAETHTGATYSTNEKNVCSEDGELNPMKDVTANKGMTIFTRLPDSPSTHGTFDVKKNYRITFTLRQTGYVSNWGCLFHFTMTGNNCCNVGDRMPAMWFEPGSNKFHIPIGDIYHGNWYLSPPHEITLNKDTPIEIIANGPNVLVKIDGIEYNYQQPNRRPTGLATLHAPDPWYTRFQGELRDFTFFTTDSPIKYISNRYKITDNMDINQIKGVYNTAYSDMISKGPNAAEGLAACKGIS
jgi:hypothetical protein